METLFYSVFEPNLGVFSKIFFYLEIVYLSLLLISPDTWILIFLFSKLDPKTGGCYFFVSYFIPNNGFLFYELNDIAKEFYGLFSYFVPIIIFLLYSFFPPKTEFGSFFPKSEAYSFFPKREVYSLFPNTEFLFYEPNTKIEELYGLFPYFACFFSPKSEVYYFFSANNEGILFSSFFANNGFELLSSFNPNRLLSLFYVLFIILKNPLLCVEITLSGSFLLSSLLIFWKNGFALDGLL